MASAIRAIALIAGTLRRGAIALATLRSLAGSAQNPSRQALWLPDRASSVPVPMLAWIRRLVPLAIVAWVAVSATGVFAKASHESRLTGTWRGYIAGNPGAGIKRQHIQIVINARETGGSWRINSRCEGPLTLDSISGGYHHYLRRLAHGASCAGGDVDCLKRLGANVYDAVTSHRGGEYDRSGTLRPVST